MKVSLLRCVCWALVCTQLAGCGDPANSAETDPTADAEAENPAPSGSAGAADDEPVRGADEHDGSETAELVSVEECPDFADQPESCGQISIKLKGRGSSCQLAPTMSDLTRLPRTVRFDCQQLGRGADGYDVDATGHITLTGETCEALQKGGPHRVTLFLACGPGSGER